MDAKRPSNECPRCLELERQVAELEALVRSLIDQVAKLSALSEEERRRGNRQAAPFSKGPPVEEPKPSGRRSGKRHGPHAHRSVSPRIDETYDAPLPPTCPHCASRQVHETHGAVQYQTEIPRTVIYRRFDVHVGTCHDCGRPVAGRHALQASWARGAAVSQLGPQVHALLAILNKELGLSHGKSVKLLGMSWYDAIRFASWLHNGQGLGDTETGAYTLLGGTATPSNGLSITRNSGAIWFLTSEDEWYKAAYHKNDGATGNYFAYPTSSDTGPTAELPPGGANSANYFPATVNEDVRWTEAGAYIDSASPYGTFDQGGQSLGMERGVDRRTRKRAARRRVQ